MKINDLKQYKPLDITQLPGEKWNNAEKVLGLDENDKVIMAEPDGAVTPEYVDDAINQAMESETARTEDVYAKKEEIPDMDDYYTKEEVDEAISGITVDLSDYYTKGETDQAISSATQDMATEQYVNDAIADIPPVDLSGYALISSVTADINTAISNETARTESTYAKPSDIPSLDGYATETYVDDAIAAIPQVDLSGYAKTTAVTQDIQTAMAAETARTESTYLKEHQSLDNYYTKSQVDSAITRVEEEIPLVPVNVSAFVNDAGYLTEHQSLAGLFNSASYDSETKRINFYDKSNVLSSYIDATAFIKDGMVERVYITGSTLVVSFNTDAGTEDIELDLTDVFDPANYYTKDQVDALMAAETARTESTYLKEHQSLANYYNKGQVDGMFTSAATMTGNAIDAAETRANAYADSVVDGYATEQYVDDAIAAIPAPEFPTDYATTGDVANAVEGLASETYVNDAISTATEHMVTTEDLDDYATEQYVNNAVNDLTLGIGMLGMVNDVSEDNGTVTVQKTGIQDGHLVTGSTSFNIVTSGDVATAITAATQNLASEQYVDDAIATAITIDDQLSTGSTNPVENRVIANALDNKASKANVVANTNTRYFPQWNSDGIVTGKFGNVVYVVRYDINGLTHYILRDKNSGALPAIYAPTSAGTQGQILVSTGGEPVWSDNNFITSGDVANQIDASMAAETARTESTYAKPSQIPSLAGYATEAWVEGKGYITGVTVDAELTSGSTNPVQSKAIYDAINGVTSSTQMEISSVDSRYEMRAQAEAVSTYTLKETNIPGYYGFNIADIAGSSSQFILQYITDTQNGDTYRANSTTFVTNNTIGVGLNVGTSFNRAILQLVSSLVDGTLNYYLVFDTNTNSVYVYKTLPVITEITDHKANVSDVPTAQDGSGFKQYVYNGDNTKQVVSRVGVSLGSDFGRSGKKGEIENTISSSVYPWNSNTRISNVAKLNIGSEYMPGIKSIKDSVVIDKADQALYGFTEQITLTLTSASTDYINNNGTQYYFSETNDPRYLVYYFDGNGYFFAPEVYLSGVKYTIKNAPLNYGTMPPTGIYQLAEVGDQYSGNSILLSGNPYYIIIDKELLTLEIAESLTITRAKNIQEALDNIPAPDMSNYYTKSEVDAEITGATQDMATETWVGQQGYATTSQIPTVPTNVSAFNNDAGYLTSHQDISGKLDKSDFNTYTAATESAMSDFVTSGDVENQITSKGYATVSQIPSLSGYATETWVQNQGYLTQHQDISGKLDKTDFNTYTGATQTILAGKADVGDIPTVPTNVSAFTNDAGYLTQHQSLANYYTKTEIDGMIGDIESLLASI